MFQSFFRKLFSIFVFLKFLSYFYICFIIYFIIEQFFIICSLKLI
jgi:hypothetical protein